MMEVQANWEQITDAWISKVSDTVPNSNIHLVASSSSIPFRLMILLELHSNILQKSKITVLADVRRKYLSLKDS
jgi:hypothetical protein